MLADTEFLLPLLLPEELPQFQVDPMPDLLDRLLVRLLLLLILNARVNIRRLTDATPAHRLTPIGLRLDGRVTFRHVAA